MKKYARKIVVAMALVIGMSVGAGAMQVAAGPQTTNTLERGDSGGEAAVVAGVSMDASTVPQGRYRIGFTEE